jgi:hypothetical protein
MLRVELYTRTDCCLCEDARAALERVRARKPFELLSIDVDSDPDLAARYGGEVPVVLVAGRKAFKYAVDERELERKLERAEAGR